MKKRTYIITVTTVDANVSMSQMEKQVAQILLDIEMRLNESYLYRFHIDEALSQPLKP